MPSRRTNKFPWKPENGRGLSHVTPTIFGSTVGYASDSLASCIHVHALHGCFLGVVIWDSSLIIWSQVLILTLLLLLKLIPVAVSHNNLGQWNNVVIWSPLYKQDIERVQRKFINCLPPGMSKMHYMELLRFLGLPSLDMHHLHFVFYGATKLLLDFLM